jgi:hypothetical protein
MEIYKIFIFFFDKKITNIIFFKTKNSNLLEYFCLFEKFQGYFCLLLFLGDIVNFFFLSLKRAFFQLKTWKEHCLKKKKKKKGVQGILSIESQTQQTNTNLTITCKWS